MPEWSEILVILVVAMVVFGPHRLPAMARKAGKMMAEFRVVARELREGIEQELAVEEMREAAQEVITTTKEAGKEVQKSLTESDRALRSSPPLARPADTKPGSERESNTTTQEDPGSDSSDQPASADPTSAGSSSGSTKADSDSPSVDSDSPPAEPTEPNQQTENPA